MTMIGTERDDRSGFVQAHERTRPAPPEDRGDDTEGGADGQDVPEGRGDGDEQRPEHQGEQDERDPDDDQAEREQGVIQPLRTSTWAAVCPVTAMSAPYSALMAGASARTCSRVALVRSVSAAASGMAMMTPVSAARFGVATVVETMPSVAGPASRRRRPGPAGRWRRRCRG